MANTDTLDSLSRVKPLKAFVFDFTNQQRTFLYQHVFYAHEQIEANALADSFAKANPLNIANSRFLLAYGYRGEFKGSLQ